VVKRGAQRPAKGAADPVQETSRPKGVDSDYLTKLTQSAEGAWLGAIVEL
jgi:hypothetical protein